METENNTENKNPEVEVIIKRHQQLLDLLGDTKCYKRLLLMLFMVMTILLVGLTLVVLAVKSMFPYSAIETNFHGATFVKNEDKETIYWLFNTAELWANSGIEVKEGDELTIRASGASYTAIHHLVESSVKNNVPQDKWVSTDGQEKKNRRDSLRAQYRIDKNSDEGILLMQVIPAKFQNNDEEWINKTDKDPMFLARGNIEVIGKERRNLRISQKGVLHFAVNDIVLTDTVLNKMYSEWIDEVAKEDSRILPTDCKSYFYKMKKGDGKQIKELADRDHKQWPNDTILKVGLEIGRYPVINGDSNMYKAYPIVNELVYYKEKGFKTPWYMDNLGSFLIVIERKR